MSSDVHDLRATIIPRSDQLNSEQLLGGPMILTVTDVRAGGGEDQPVSIYYEADPGRPYKPCKTMRKVLILAWGPDGTKWVGKSMELYCDPSVKFGGEMVGGIRISRLTDIEKAIKVSLTATKGRKAMHEIGLLQMTTPPLGADVINAFAALGVTTAQIAVHLGREPNAQDTKALKAWYRDLKAGKVKPPAVPDAGGSFLDPDDDPSTGSDEITFTFDQVKANIEGAQTTDVLDLARDQITGVQDEEERAFLTDLADKRAEALGAQE